MSNQERIIVWVHDHPLTSLVLTIATAVVMFVALYAVVEGIVPDSAYDKGRDAYDEYGTECMENGYIGVRMLGTDFTDAEIKDYALGCADAAREDGAF